MLYAPSNVNTTPAIRLDYEESDPVVIATTNPVEIVATQFQASLSSGTNPVSITLIKPVRWPVGLYFVLTEMVSGLAPGIPIVVGEQQFGDMYMAALSSVCPPSNPTLHDQSVHNAVEAAVVLHPGGSRTAAQQISDRIKEVGGKRPLAEIHKQIEGLIAGHSEDDGPTHKTPQQFAEVLVDQPGDETGPLIYSQSMNTFYVYQDGAWREMSDSEMAIRITGFLQEQEDISVTRTLVNDVLANVKAICHVPDSGYQPPYFMIQRAPLALTQPLLTQFANGILNLGGLVGWHGSDADETGLFDFDEHFHAGGDTRFVNLSVLPYNYDPAATCPGWLAMLDTVLPTNGNGDRRQAVLQEYFGYTLLAGSSAFEKMLLMVGLGRNGKSTLMKLWKQVLGERNVSHVDFNRLDKDAMRLSMFCKLANFISELDYMSKANEGILKQFISGEPITTDVKFKEAVTVPIHAKLVVACNMLPKIADNSEGIWRRLIIMPFDVQISEANVDPHLAAELMAELPGIFNWAVVGLRRLIQHGGFTSCNMCEAQKADHRRESNTVLEFVTACCMTGESHAVVAQDLYQIYNTFMVERGRKPVAENHFGADMKRLGFEKFRVSAALRTARSRAYRGISLNDEGLDWAKRAKVIETSLNKSSWSNYPQAAANALPSGCFDDEAEDDSEQSDGGANDGGGCEAEDSESHGHGEQSP